MKNKDEKEYLEKLLISGKIISKKIKTNKMLEKKIKERINY